MIRAVVTHDLAKLVDRCSLDSWKQVLAVVTTYADNKEFPILAGKIETFTGNYGMVVDLI